MAMNYDGRYGKVAGAMKRKRAMNRFGSGDAAKRGKNSGFTAGSDFQAGGGPQKLPDNKGVPRYKHGDNTSGTAQDRRIRHPASMRPVSPSKGKRDAYQPTQGEPKGPRSPMPEYQDKGKHPVKRDSREKATGFRSFQSIIKGNVMGMRPPKKLPKNSRPVKASRMTY